jgi:RHS repeat-associated protein
MTAGQSYNVSVTMRNTGTNTWTASSLYRLGSQNPQDNVTWGVGRIELPTSVAPTSSVTFNFIVTAPSAPGTYNFQWRMLREMVEWFGDFTTNVTVTVSSGSQPVPRDGLASLSYDQATNRISTAGWEYDAAGNQTRAQRADGTWQRYVYDAAGRLVKVQNDSNVTQLVNTYGASNHRLIEQVGNESSNQRTYYAWAGDSVIAEYEETPSVPSTPRWVKSYVYLGARLLATIAPNGQSERVEYHHPDRLGTRLVTNNQDTTSFEQVTLPFGTALDAESSGSTKRRFTSYDRSTLTGLDYAVNRHYDPLQGRFTQVDPIGMSSTSLANPQTLNLYAYCANDPINHTDPSGLGFFSFIGKIFGAIGRALHRIAKVLAVVAVVAAVVFLAWEMPVFAGAFAAMAGLLFAQAYGPPIVGKLLSAAWHCCTPGYGSRNSANQSARRWYWTGAD